MVYRFYYYRPGSAGGRPSGGLRVLILRVLAAPGPEPFGKQHAMVLLASRRR